MPISKIKLKYRVLCMLFALVISAVCFVFLYTKARMGVLSGIWIMTASMVFVASGLSMFLIVAINSTRIILHDEYLAERMFGYYRYWINYENIAYVRPFDSSKIKNSLLRLIYKNAIQIGSDEKSIVLNSWYSDLDKVVEHLEEVTRKEGREIEVSVSLARNN